MASRSIRTLTAPGTSSVVWYPGTEVGGMNGEINVVALVRGEEQYIFMFDEANRTETLRMLGRYAANPELSFTWYDAAVLSQKVREMLPAKTSQPTPATNSLSHQELQSPVGTSAKITKTAPRFKLS